MDFDFIVGSGSVTFDVVCGGSFTRCRDEVRFDEPPLILLSPSPSFADLGELTDTFLVELDFPLLTVFDLVGDLGRSGLRRNFTFSFLIGLDFAATFLETLAVTTVFAAALACFSFLFIVSW